MTDINELEVTWEKVSWDLSVRVGTDMSEIKNWGELTYLATNEYPMSQWDRIDKLSGENDFCLCACVYRALEEGQISVSKSAALLGCSINDLRSELGVE